MSSYQIKLFSRKNQASIESAGIFNALKPVSNETDKDLSLALDNIFRDSAGENKLERARTILGDIAENMSDDDLISSLAQFQILLDGWFDEFEMSEFGGVTLIQILKGGENGEQSS